MPRLISKNYHPVASKAYRRRDHWGDYEDAFNHLRKKKLFKNLSDESLRDHLKSSLTPHEGGGLTLSFSKRWEEHCFTSVINPWGYLSKCPIPILGICGENSDLIGPEIIQRWKQLSPQSNIKTIKSAGHLVPLEKPMEVARIINSSV